MAIDEHTEERINEARTRKRQDKACPLLIRDDGMLFPNVPLVAKKGNFRKYHGDPRASLEDRLRYLQGFGQRRKVTYTPEPDFELGKANADEIVAFAMEEYGAVLDGSMPIGELRTECYRLSQLPDMELPMASPSYPAAQANAQAPAPAPTALPPPQAPTGMGLPPEEAQRPRGAMSTPEEVQAAMARAPAPMPSTGGVRGKPVIAKRGASAVV